MRVLLANKFYYRRGGDCIYTLNLEQLLKDKGHEVAVFAMDYPENLDSPWSKYFPSEISMRPGFGVLEALRRPFGSGEVKNAFSRLLDDFKPDVLHLNNIHTQLSPIIAELAHARGIRVVWTIHDLKLVCPRYDCLQNGGKICQECFGDSKLPVLRHRCMKNSFLASVIAYKEACSWSRSRLEACTDVFLCPSAFMAGKMISGGFDKKKIVTLCNFIDVAKCFMESYSNRKNYFCYVGRLSHEKGVRSLVKAAVELPFNLKVVGDGPLREELEGLARDKSNIEFLGFNDWAGVKDVVGHAKFVVSPSVWFENNPLSVLEAKCLGTPVLGADIGGIPELIRLGSGMTFESSNVAELAEKLCAMWTASFDYDAIARESQLEYSAERYYDRLMEIYKR